MPITPAENKVCPTCGHVQAPLKDRRVELGLSLEALAKKSGVPKSTISRIELGKSEPSPATRKKLANALDIDPSEV